MASTLDTYCFGLHNGEEANGVAQIVGSLLEQNLERFPERIRYARRMRRPVTILSNETDSACTVAFEHDGGVVYDDVVGRPSVMVNATEAPLLDLAQLQMKAGGLLPVGFLTARGRDVLRQILTHKLVVKGLLSHPVTALRTIALISVVES